MNGYELEVHRQGTYQMGQNCSPGLNGLGAQASSLGCYPYQQYCYCPLPRPLCDWEIHIEQVSADFVSINYGAKLRLLMADPFKGVELREALHELKIALKEVFQHAS